MRLFFGLLLSITFISGCTNPEETDIRYTVEKTEFNNQPALKVTVDFKPFEGNKTELLYQDRGWGQDSLHNVLHEVQIIEGASQIIQQREKDHFEIYYPENTERVVVEYTLVQDTAGDLDTQKAIRPIINEEYFHVFSHNLFMLPRNVLTYSEDDFSVAINWVNFDDGYIIQNSFGGGNEQYIDSISEANFHSAVFVGGDFRTHTIDVNTNLIVFATRGEWDVFKDSTMVNVLEKTVRAQRDFWQDHTQEYFLVSMIPTVQESGYSFHGTGLTNSFATSVSDNQNVEVEGLVYLFNHELQHNWTGKVIENENEEEQYWFSEGFTEYYGFKNIAINKIYGLDANYLISKLNENILNLYNSPLLSAPNSEINYDNFWSSMDYSKLPYYRGALFAFYLDMKIQRESNGKLSLDDLMLTIKNDAIDKNVKLNHDYFIKTTNLFLAQDIRPFFEKHILQGVPMDLSKLYDSFGLEFKDSSKVFDLGFTFDEEQVEVSSIDPNSEAYKAGLRAGDRIFSRSYHYDHTKEAEFVISRDGSERTIRYLPVKEAPIPSLLNSEINKAVLIGQQNI